MSSIAENPAAEPAHQPAPANTSSAVSVITPDEAIDRCVAAYHRAYNASLAKGEHISHCRQAGGHAFRMAMPSTGSLAEVQAFIACIIRGIHLDIWVCNQARELFYAAQVSISAYRCQTPKKTK